MSIQLDFENTTDLSTPDESQFQTWVNAALVNRVQTTDIELSICIVSEDEMTQLNSQFRDKEKSTNVLSFPADIPPEVEINLLGDIAICAAVIEREAKEQSKPLDAHYAHMAIHGVLHLIGYDHIEDNQADEMERLEKTILTSLGYPNPYESINE